MKLRKRLMSIGLTAAMVLPLMACGGGNGGDSIGNGESADNGSEESAAVSTQLPTLDSITLKTSADGEGDYSDLTASIKVLTNRTDIVDTVYKGYAEQFMEIYPNITVEYEGITDYEESLRLRLTTGD